MSNLHPAEQAPESDLEPAEQAPESDVEPAEAPASDQATSRDRLVRWPSRVPAPVLLAMVAAVAALTVAASSPDPGSPEGVRFRAPDPAAAKPFPDLEATPTTVTPSPVPASPALDASVLRLPGPVPSTGTGSFQYTSSAGLLLGTAGPLRRYRVAVETGSGVDPEEFAAVVDEALGDERSWTGGGRRRLQRVPGGADHDFTVLLATARTAGRLCAAGGVNIQIGGRPYTSCRVSGKVILNLDRWHLSVDHLVAAGIPLAQYRIYLVNHEVGHELGYGHEGCPRRGAPAPVMMQQTLVLGGCVPNPWPYSDGARYAGPRV